MTDHVKMTQEEFYALLTERFGDDVSHWAFECPSCHDVATVSDFREALEANPRTRRDGTQVKPTDIIGQECIGRLTGALSAARDNTRGCDWCAFGLFRGPWEIELPDGKAIWCFPVAEPNAVAGARA